MKCENCTKYDDCRTGSGLTWPCGAYRPKTGGGMDIEKLIEQLRKSADFEDYPIVASFAAIIEKKYLREAATALSTLQAENERLRGELESKEKYYEQMISALSATDSADLAQTTACVYYKPGGLCRYGGDDPANVCVLGPCPHERTAEEVLADLARVTQERDAAVKDMEALMWFSGEGCHICAHEIIIHKEPYVRSKCALGNCAACCPTWRGQKED